MTASPAPTIDSDVAYRAVMGRDPRFDGRLFVGVLSTGIYCRPSCPSRTPKRENCQFHLTAAGCVAAGFRACRRCRPDALPGSRDWDVDADLAHRALRLIGDGAVDDAGVAGLARRVNVSARHLHRVLVAQVGASPVQIARTRRAQVARMLVEQTSWPMSDVAFAAGFASVRQFNDVFRAEYGATPTALRPQQPMRGASTGPGASTSSGGSTGPGSGSGLPRGDRGATLTVRLRTAQPMHAEAYLRHVTARAVPGLEAVDGATVRRVVPGRGGPILVELTVDGQVTARLSMTAIDDLPRVVGRLRHWADLDADPVRVDAVLGADPLLAPMVAARPGLRVPGTADPAELAIRTVLGQQVSVAAARTLTARLVATFGEPTVFGLSQFPTPDRLAAAGPDVLARIGLTTARAATLARLAEVLAAGLDLGPGADRDLARATLGSIPGVGPWTVEYVALRAMGDPDAFPSHDLVLRQALGGLSAAEAGRRAEAWRPWRGYAAQHLWTSRTWMETP
ncbi:Ada metal-binding domain-containing protein [Cellulomonas sp. KRMCY2]|uniref:Ada metal-binding domain-containing protein n=1 Tax=Cellulomonas sp. KRMCY2 TaxID=1304865 RepID=UPI0004B8F3C4|nr:Ada metal-binding domain-containing protein [Cellulomonas sp. KRMCY2]